MKKVRCQAKNPKTCKFHGTSIKDNLTTSSKTLTYKNVDNTLDVLRTMIKAASRFDKQAKVKARKAVDGEVIKTILKDGTVEATNTAKDGDIIVTNPGGEEYIVTEENFFSRYKKTSESGVFEAMGTVQAIRNPFFKSISLTAPWGERQYGSTDCWLAIPVGSNETPYIIASEEFEETYGGVMKGY